jgi:hypothetical protein
MECGGIVKPADAQVTGMAGADRPASPIGAGAMTASRFSSNMCQAGHAFVVMVEERFDEVHRHAGR